MPSQTSSNKLSFLFPNFWGDWLLHVVIWSLLLLICGYRGWDWLFFSGADGSLWIAVLYGYFFNALLFYGNAFFLYPRFYQGRPKLFWVLSIAWLLICQSIEVLIDGAFGSFLIRVPSFAATLSLAAGAFWVTLLINAIFWALGIAYHLPLELIHKKREHQFLLQEKLEAELAFLRAQINPHSLFNGINSIYHLIDQQPNQAKETLLQLSELLRYQLYECREDYIDLDKELLNLQNYISLEEIRKGENALISTAFPFSKEKYEVAPLLLIPFVENAFKYLSHYPEKEDNRLNLVLKIEDQRLVMHLCNSFQEQQKQANALEGGIGLENVRRRLNLIYANSYQLTIKKEAGQFEVLLDIPLKRIG
ncbi:MAG: histidine kinase [Saprospiraceae bacterium]|nr:histidine kinase [Saprospiraceae bacterium]